MRIGVFLVVALVACAGLSIGADNDLAEIEKTAGAKYDAKDYQAAIGAYEAALKLARETSSDARVPFYFRRLGLSHNQLGQNDAALAAYREGVTAAEKANDESMLAENLHGAANILQRIGRFQEALPLCEREYALTEKAGQPEAMIRALNTWAQTLGQLGRIRESLPLQERAVELSRRSSRKDDYPLSLGNLAMYYGELGDYETSLRLMISLPTQTPNNLNAIAIIQMRLHREEEAIATYRKAISASEAPADWRIHAGLLNNLGTVLAKTGKLADARAAMEQSLTISLDHNDLGGESRALAQLSEIEAETNNAAAAMDDATKSLRLARESESPEIMVNALVAQARAWDASGHEEEAGLTFREAVWIAEGRRADAPASAAGLQGEVEQWIPTYRYAVSHEIHAKRALGALQMADRAKARVLLDMLDGGKPGFDALADPKERADEQQVRDEVARARQAAVAKPTAASKAALEKALRKEDDFNLQLYARHPELVLQRAAPPEIVASDLAALLPDGHTALLSSFILQDAVALFVVRGDKPGVPAVSAFTLSGGDKLNTLIRSFRSQIGARDLDYRVSAKNLYDALLAPASNVLRGTDRWILSPDGALWDVPFQALMDPQGKHVLETHSLSYTPSLSVLRQLRAKPAAPPSTRGGILVVANPSVKGMAPIPDAEREANAIIALYRTNRTTLLTGDKASARAFREGAGGADMIHIASHAETETSHPLESFLLFADSANGGALTARDMLGMRLHANLVILSACETARGKIGDGDGVMGLGWAVLAAGARASVLSLWKVDSAATSDLMIDFHKRLTASKPTDKAEALRQASLDTMRSPGRLHPFYWAAFITVGDAR
jgi:CHAT domain-containing protein